MPLPSIAYKLPLEENKDFTLESALDAWLTSKDGKLGYRITEDRTLVFEDTEGNTVISGKLKVGDDLDIGGKIFFRNGLVVEGDTWLRDKLRVEEDTVLDGDVYINANLYVSKDFQLGQDGSIRGNFSVEDSLTVNDLIVTGNANINSLLNVNNDQVITGNLTLGGYLVGGDITEPVTETGHSKVAGNAVYFNGTTWELAQSDNVATLGTGIVSLVPDANTFYVTQMGKVTGLSQLSVGEWYYVSDSTAGLLSLTQGATIVNPIGRALSATELMVFPMRADLVQPSVDGLTNRAEYDSTNSSYLYTGRASRGSLTSDAVWRISRYDFETGTVTTADGDSLYDNIYDNRESLSYS